MTIMIEEVILKCGRKVPVGLKSSLLEDIVYFEDKHLIQLGQGYIKGSLDLVEEIPLGVDVRYFLENEYTKRHPIPYVLLKYKDKYYLADRLKGGTEARLHGKKGLLGGHVDKSDMEYLGLSTKSELFEYAMLRELKEEVSILRTDIIDIDFKGYIRIVDNNAVEGVHLGLIYIIELNTDKISSQEEHILKGRWYSKEEIEKEVSTLENWSRLVIENEILNRR